MMHVRKALAAERGITAARLMRPALTLKVQIPVYDPLRTLREFRNHLAAVADVGQGSG
jgi:hypothetical protein